MFLARLTVPDIGPLYHGVRLESDYRAVGYIKTQKLILHMWAHLAFHLVLLYFLISANSPLLPTPSAFNPLPLLLPKSLYFGIPFPYYLCFPNPPP